MQRVTSVNELNAELDSARERGLEIAFVPTMGALHDGHISLVEIAKQNADFVVVSIFVNPLQFAANEDFDKYPRNLQADAEKLVAVGVDAVFAPTVQDVYPNGDAITQHAGRVGKTFEGSVRPEHFDGMLTVVAKLFEAVRPKYAVFGAKDAQQVFLVKQMAAHKFPDLEIVVAPTVREANGLALSSRNRYLSEADHEVAEHISAALRTGHASATSGSAGPQAVIDAARTVMAKVPEAKLDYIALVDADTFEAVTDGFTGRAILLIAAVVGETRLIDNLEITF